MNPRTDPGDTTPGEDEAYAALAADPERYVTRRPPVPRPDGDDTLRRTDCPDHGTDCGGDHRMNPDYCGCNHRLDRHDSFKWCQVCDKSCAPARAD